MMKIFTFCGVVIIKAAPSHGAAGGERRIWERMEKIGRIEKSELPNLNW